MRPGKSPSTSGQSDADFRAKVQDALDDPRPAIPGEKVAEYFAGRRAAALEKASGKGMHLPVFGGRGGLVDGISGLSNKQLLDAADVGVSSDS